MKINVWVIVLVYALCLMSFSGCIKNDNITADRESSIVNDEAEAESELLLMDENYNIAVYGITENETEKIRIMYEEETIEIAGSFSNIYDENAHVCVNDIDNDSFDEIVLAIRRETGTRRTYDFYICDKEVEWKVITYDCLNEDVLEIIAYQYDAGQNLIVFKEGDENRFEAVLPDWSAAYPYAGEVSFTDKYSYDVSAMTVEVIPEIKMTDSLPYEPLSIKFDILYKEGKIELQFNQFVDLESNADYEAEANSSISNPNITSIRDINNEQMEIFFSYIFDGEERMDFFISKTYPSYGVDMEDRVSVRILDMDGDGIEELIFKVNAIGNTMSELCGSLHIFKITDNGCEEILCQDSNWETPDGNWISALCIDEGKLYVETGTKIIDEEGPLVITKTYLLEYTDGNWTTQECNPNFTEHADIW